MALGLLPACPGGRSHTCACIGYYVAAYVMNVLFLLEVARLAQWPISPALTLLSLLKDLKKPNHINLGTQEPTQI